jgi:hypothetical protein
MNSFDWLYYLDKYPDLRANGLHTEQQALQHWLYYGEKEGRVSTRTPPLFDWQYYLEKYPDLRANGIHTETQALQHWLDYGEKEGRIHCNNTPCNNTTYIIKSINPKHYVVNSLNLDKTNISIIYQFFIHSDVDRQNEIKFCLKANQENPYINHIYLLNEKLYSLSELGLDNMDKITQVLLGHRLQYNDIFMFSKTEEIKGWIVACNADIFLDNSIYNIKNIDQTERLMFSQLRWEFEGDLTTAKIFGPRTDSQDAWIWHSNNTDYLVTYEEKFNFQLGIPGCDNHVVHIFDKIGFHQINAPNFIKTLHYHKTQIRNYAHVNAINPPYCWIDPLF